MTRRTKAVLLIGCLMAGGACYRKVDRPIVGATVPEFNRGSLRGFVLRDGTVVNVDRSDRVTIVGDSLIIREARANEFSRRDAVYHAPDTLRIANVTHFRVSQFSGRRTAAAVILIPLGVLAALAVAFAASSCPFIYVYDGTNFVPAAEPLAGAISAGLARTDLSELEGMVAADGTYRIIIGNEIDETQYVDAFHLIAIDHPAGSRVVADRSGTPRLLHDAQAPVRARDQAGKDLLPALSRNDDVWWPGNAGGPVFDTDRTRDTLTLTFARPATTDTAMLVIHARNDVWGAYMLKRMMQLWGGQVDQWYRMLDESAALRASNEEWVLREETWVMKLWVHEADGWAAQDVVMGGGPYISELQTVPVDLSRVSGDEVQVRLHPPQGYWRIDHVALATSAASIGAIHELHASAPALLHGVDVRDLLREPDGRYMVMREIGDRVELHFTVPPSPAAGFTRTLFARTSGYYRIHTERTGARQAAQLDSIWLAPGFPVEFARREYAVWQRQNGGAPLYHTTPAVANQRQ